MVEAQGCTRGIDEGGLIVWASLTLPARIVDCGRGSKRSNGAMLLRVADGTRLQGLQLLKMTIVRSGDALGF